MSNLGAWEADKNLSKTAQSNRGLGADADLQPNVRFKRGVVKLIRSRMSQQDASGDPNCPAIFLLQPNIVSCITGEKPKRVPMLDVGREVVTGRLWFVNEVVVTGKYVEINKNDDLDTLFTIITDKLQFGDIPAIVFLPGENPCARFYPNGLADDQTCEDITVNGSDVSLNKIFEAIEKVYQQCLITPDAQTKASKLWKDHSKWWAAENAEDLIQAALKSGLATAFPTCVIRHEQPSASGRFDLSIEEKLEQEQNVIIHAILELKVLRSFGSSGTAKSDNENQKWIESGVKQAASYRNDRGGRSAALCCFDMRKVNSGDDCFNDVRSLAQTLAVELKNWYLFGNSSDYRTYITQSITEA